MRAATYSRFSSDNQKDTSLVDQDVATARFAAAHGWTIRPEHRYSDAAVSGSSLDRPGIQRLLADVEQRPRPFDVLLVDDSSRVSRDLADAVRFMQQLTFRRVRCIYISQNIDSAHEQAETLIAVHGIVDSLYLSELSKKVKRGLAGQLQRGFATGSRTFGYRSTPVLDPTGKKTPEGYPAQIGKSLAIVPDEARVIVQIFEWFASGIGIRHIVDRLNQQHIVGPRGGTWKFGAVRRLLGNEKFTGKLIWGQRRAEREPGSRRRIARALPRDQWQVLERPDLRIVSDDLWTRAQARFAELHEFLKSTERNGTLLRGRNARVHSKYLFSGFLTCAECGGSIVIMHSGTGKPRYGCSGRWRHGRSTCTNQLTVRASVVDGRLLEALRAELLAPTTLDYITSTFTAELNRRLSDRPQRQAEAQAARNDAATRLQRLVRALEDGTPAQSVLAAVREREADLARLDAELAALAEPLDRRLAVMPAWVRQQLENLAGLLSTTAVEQTKAELQRLHLQTTLHVIRREDGRSFYRAHTRAALPWLSGIRDLGASAADRLLR